MKQSTNGVCRQNFMLAVRQELGWPSFKPANDAIAFCAGRRIDFELGLELARIAQMLNKDAVYTAWANTTTTTPLAFSIVYRDLLAVDIVDRVVPYAANDDAPIVFVNARSKEIFAVDRRGSLVRFPGKPSNVGTGHKLAMKRIRATAATMSDDLLENNRFVPTGADWVEPAASVATVVRFG